MNEIDKYLVQATKDIAKLAAENDVELETVGPRETRQEELCAVIDANASALKAIVAKS